MRIAGWALYVVLVLVISMAIGGLIFGRGLEFMVREWVNHGNSYENHQ